MGTEVEMEVEMEVGEVGMIEMGGSRMGWGWRWRWERWKRWGWRWRGEMEMEVEMEVEKGGVGTELCRGQAKSSRRTARDLSSVLSDVWKER